MFSLANLLPPPLNTDRPNIRLSSTEAMASLSPHFFGPALRAPSPPLLVRVAKRGKCGEDRGAGELGRSVICRVLAGLLEISPRIWKSFMETYDRI
jgi:hypothetical protein